MPQDDLNFRSFPATQWSLVARAGDIDEATRREALGRLLTRYMPALRMHLVARKRLPADRADDLVQAFVADKVVEQNLLRFASKDRGKFRTFLLSALDNYQVSQWRKDNAQRRAPTGGMGELNEELSPIVDDSPATDAFDIAWAREILAEAVRRMRGECEGSNRPELWALFEDRVLGPSLNGSEPMAYGELARKLKLRSPEQLSNLLVTAKRMFSRTLKQVIGEYARDESEIDEEILDLRKILQGV